MSAEITAMVGWLAVALAFLLMIIGSKSNSVAPKGWFGFCALACICAALIYAHRAFGLDVDGLIWVVSAALALTVLACCCFGFVVGRWPLRRPDSQEAPGGSINAP